MRGSRRSRTAGSGSAACPAACPANSAASGRQDALADDRRLDQRARVDRRRRPRCARASRRSPRAPRRRPAARRRGGQTATLPSSARSTPSHWPAFCGCGRTSTPSSRSAGSRLGRERLEPAPDERDLVGRDERRRARVEHERPRRRRARPSRRTLARSVLGAPLEPLVELRRAGGDDPLARDAVHLRRLARPGASFQTKTRSGTTRISPLPVRLSQLATQTPMGSPRLPRALQVLDLGARELDDRRDEHGVGPLPRGGSRRSRRRSGSPARPRPETPTIAPREPLARAGVHDVGSTRRVSARRERVDRPGAC